MRLCLAPASVLLATCVAASSANASDAVVSAHVGEQADAIDSEEPLGVFPSPRTRSVGLGFSLAPVAAEEVASKVSTEVGRPDYDYFLGGRASATLHFSVGIASEIVAGVFAAPSTSATAPGVLMPVGARIEARYDVMRPVFSGLALSGGYLIAPDVEPTHQFVYEPVSSVFYAPELIPIGLRLGENEEIELGLSISVLFSQQDDLAGSIFSTSYFTQTLWARYVLPL